MDDSYLQPIVYLILMAGTSTNKRYFCTTRIGDEGDARLKGLRSIGVGGHVDEDEVPVDAFYRELMEEVGVGPEQIFTARRMGYIYDNTTAVGRVHLGLVHVVWLKTPDISVVETDKLTGEWVTMEQLVKYRDAGEMESWSVMCVDQLEREERK